MEELGWNADFWHWWILAGLLLLIEVMAPGFFFLWLAMAAGIVGLAMLLVPDIGWQYQLMIFSGLALISIIGFRKFQKAIPAETDQPTLNRRGSQYVGRTFTLDQPVVNGMGVLRVDDTTWRIAGQDLPAGSKVRVTGLDGVVLQIEPLSG